MTVPRAGHPRGRDVFAVSPAQLLQSLHTLHTCPSPQPSSPFPAGAAEVIWCPCPQTSRAPPCDRWAGHMASEGTFSNPGMAVDTGSRPPLCSPAPLGCPHPVAPLQQGHPTLVTLDAFRAAVPHPPRLRCSTPACLEARPEIWPWSQDWDFPLSFPSSFLTASASPALGHCRCHPPYKREMMKSKVTLLFPAHLCAKGSLGSLHTVSHLTLGTLGTGPIISPIPQVGM